MLARVSDPKTPSEGGAPLATETRRPPSTQRTPAAPPVERIGLARRPVFGDLYHYLLVTSWARFFALIAGTYLAANAVFALLYRAVPGSLESAAPGSFADCFFFSIQTMATIGYGKMVPATLYANVLVTFESLLGILGVALVTGLTFAKFARPTARVLFSRVCVVAQRDGVRSLLFRMANERDTQIVDANLHVVLSIEDVTPEGEKIRRFHSLELARDRAATFALSWTGIHPITAKSALFGLTKADLVGRNANLIVSLTGIDETFATTVHARASYGADAVLFDAVFEDIIVWKPDGTRAVDYTKFHATRPAPSA